MKIILASKSPRRKTVLEENGYEVEVDVSHADEDSMKAGDIREMVKAIAKLKAETVAKRHDGVIVAADTMVYFNGKAIGQQKDRKEAGRTLRMLLGKTHEVYTGICIISKNGDNQKIIQGLEMTKVKLRDVDEEELKRYIDADTYKGKAGAYSIDDPEFKSFIESIEGSYTNVMGLPIERFKKMMKEVV